MEITKNTKASWFGFPVLCKTKDVRDKFQRHLEKMELRLGLLFVEI